MEFNVFLLTRSVFEGPSLKLLRRRSHLSMRFGPGDVAYTPTPGDDAADPVSRAVDGTTSRWSSCMGWRK